jgi:hypothetical protein
MQKCIVLLSYVDQHHCRWRAHTVPKLKPLAALGHARS